jgi:HlyD family secretion protein
MRERIIDRLGAAIFACGLAIQSTAFADPQAVSALGRLEPRHGVIVVSSSSLPEATLGGVLTELLVEEGDDVTAGQLLAVTDAAGVLAADIESRRAELVYARQEVETARSASEEACVRAKVAQQEAERRVRLQAQGVAGEEEAQSAQGEAEARAAACRSSQAAVKLTEAGVQVAEARLRRAEAGLGRAQVRAPIDGRVLHITRRPGELLGEAGVLEMGDVENMFAVAEVYETDIRRVREGQRAVVTSKALDADLEGTVTHIRQMVAKQDEIGTDPAARKDARIVEVLIELDDSSAAGHLTNLQVDIVIRP